MGSMNSSGSLWRILSPRRLIKNWGGN